MYTKIDEFITTLEVTPYSQYIQFYKIDSDKLLENFLIKNKYHYTIQKQPIAYLSPEGANQVSFHSVSIKQTYLLVFTIWRTFFKPKTYVLHCSQV